jgi:hypothetical protein
VNRRHKGYLFLRAVGLSFIFTHYVSLLPGFHRPTMIPRNIE